ncbi:MAG: GntR family transcriptional regulator [Burkholderiaceae bacterium]
MLRTLRDAIVSGALPPGHRLVETDLCARLGVSRPSLREALRQLEAERLVCITPYKGPSVASMSWQEAANIYEVRALLEGHAVFLFAERADAQALAELRQALEAFEAAVRDADAAGLLRWTGAFYDVILRGCANEIIAETIIGLLARINLLRARSMSLHGRSRFSARELRAIYTAIRRRDPAGARDAAIQHVHNARAAAQQALNVDEAAAASMPERTRG